jgi:3-keto-5-aminohexanoate cleavage enzyme
MNKLIINFTPTGMIPTKAMTHHVPETPREIASDIFRCAELGASMAHIHAREKQGLSTYKKEVFAEIIRLVREKNQELVIVVSTSGRHYSEFEQRAEVLNLEGEVRPDMASLTLGSVNFNKIASMNPPEMVQKLAEKMKEKGIKPELEVFDLGMVNYAHYLIRKGLIEPPHYFNIILGNIATAQARLLHLGLIVSELPENSFWSVGGVGNWQKTANAIALVSGEGGVRVGLEDNIWYDDARTVLATNAMLVERVVKLASLIGRPLATAREVREMLKLPHG